MRLSSRARRVSTGCPVYTLSLTIGFSLIRPAERNGVVFELIRMHLWAQIERTVLDVVEDVGRQCHTTSTSDVGIAAHLLMRRR